MIASAAQRQIQTSSRRTTVREDTIATVKNVGKIREMAKNLKPVYWNIIIIIITLIIIFTLRNTTASEKPMAFPPTLFINLNRETGRLKTLNEDFKFAGWPVPLERVEAVEKKPGYIGCTLSHKKCLELAVQRDYDWVLILEDDCLLKPRARDRFTALLPELWETRQSWDIYSAGPVTINTHELVNRRSGLFKISGQSSHFVLVHKEACKKILKSLANLKELEPIDWFYRHHMRILTSVPYIATQRPGISSVVIKGDNKVVDHTEKFNQTEQKLLAIL